MNKIKAMKKNSEELDCEITVGDVFKSSEGSSLFTVVIRDITERNRLLAKQRERQEKEISSLENISQSGYPSISAKLLATELLSKCNPTQFRELVQKYIQLMDRAFEQQIFKVDYDISNEIRSYSEQLCILKVGPRDIVEIHTTMLEEKKDRKSPKKSLSYVEEGRILLFKVMGYMISYYRNYYLGFRTSSKIDNSNKLVNK